MLSLFCFSAGKCFSNIKELMPRCVILTSGTLSPFPSFQQELKLEFPLTLENPHVISNQQIKISVVKRGVNGNPFNFNFQNKNNMEMVDDLGATLAQVAKTVPDGVLVFFPSYRTMESARDQWLKTKTLDEIAKQKPVFMEPKNSAEYQSIMNDYYKAIFEEKSKGAILMGVCRGRISEGLDFSDKAARCVIVVGIPYPQVTDPKIILKRDYLDNLKSLEKDSLESLSGSKWYNQQATRAVNQAIGRVIRHVQDYGSILLVDERYAYNSNKSQVSKWLRNRITEHSNFAELSVILTDFFADMKARGFVAKVQ